MCFRILLKGEKEGSNASKKWHKRIVSGNEEVLKVVSKIEKMILTHGTCKDVLDLQKLKLDEKTFCIASSKLFPTNI